MSNRSTLTSPAAPTPKRMPELWARSDYPTTIPDGVDRWAAAVCSHMMSAYGRSKPLAMSMDFVIEHDHMGVNGEAEMLDILEQDLRIR